MGGARLSRQLRRERKRDSQQYKSSFISRRSRLSPHSAIRLRSPQRFEKSAVSLASPGYLPTQRSSSAVRNGSKNPRSVSLLPTAHETAFVLRVVVLPLIDAPREMLYRAHAGREQCLRVASQDQGAARTDPLQLPAAVRARTVEREGYRQLQRASPWQSGANALQRQSRQDTARMTQNAGASWLRRSFVPSIQLLAAPVSLPAPVAPRRVPSHFCASTFTFIPSIKSAFGFVTIVIPSLIPPTISIVAPKSRPTCTSRR